MENKRLTEKFYHNGFEYMATGLGANYPYAIDKLGKLEDLEEQIGCPLEVVFKALTNGVYYEDNTNYMIYLPVDLRINLDGDYVLYYDDEEYLLTKNYKKTWWLKENREE